MAPNISSIEAKMCTEKDSEKEESSVPAKMMDSKNGTQNGSESYTKIEGWFKFKTELKWFNIVSIILLHMFFVYAVFTIRYFEDVNLKTVVWTLVLGVMQAVGITAGAHRLWTHRSYKATWQFRTILLIFYSIGGQNNLYEWVRDHRVHHKYTDTDADPHNSNRGFFFSHVGWLMMKKHPEVIRMGRQIDMSDILADPIVAFGSKYFEILKFTLAFLLPVIIPVYAWHESWYEAFTVQIIRYVIGLNNTWSVNSVAHIWGSKPYDAHINPTENKYVSFVTFGEGWHNYHHVFPWDYKAAELGNYNLNFTTMFIDLFAKIGWTYDFKQPSEELVKIIATKKGDGSYLWWEPVAHPDDKIE